MKKSVAATVVLSRALAISQRGAERDRDQRDFGRRIGVGERAADGAAGPRRGVADMGQRLGQQRDFGADQRIVLDHALPRRGADRHRVAVIADECQLRNPRDINELRRPRQPHRHQRHQRLPARDQADVVALRQQRAGFVEVRGPGIVE